MELSSLLVTWPWGQGSTQQCPFLASLSHLAYLASAQPAILNSSPGIVIEFFTAHLDATLEAAVLGGHSSRELLAVGVPYETLMAFLYDPWHSLGTSRVQESMTFEAQRTWPPLSSCAGQPTSQLAA